MLRQLGARNIASILIEPGATLAASIMKEKLFNELTIFYGTLFFGGDARPSVGTLDLLSIKNTPRLSLKSVERIDGSDDVLVRFKHVDSPN